MKHATTSSTTDAAVASQPLTVETTRAHKTSWNSMLWFSVKCSAAAVLLFQALGDGSLPFRSTGSDAGAMSRRLQALGDAVPHYMTDLMDDLAARKKLFDETPPEEVKYWFEYTGPLQVSRGTRGMMQRGLARMCCFVRSGEEDHDCIMHSST